MAKQGGGLGLGLGLNRKQQQGLSQAVQTPGGGEAWLAQHPHVQQRINRVDPTSQQATNIGNYIGAGVVSPTAAKKWQPAQPAAGAQPPQGSGPTGASKPSGGGQQPPAAAAPTTPAATTPSQPATYTGALQGQYGTGNPFGMQSWYGSNPLQTAQDLANQNLGKNLAQIRNTYSGGGLGTSAQEALAEGTATAQSNVGLGDVMAQRGQEAYAADATRGLQALLGAGAQQLQGQQNQIAATSGLGQLGQVLSQLGATEQGIPNANLIANILGLFTQQSGTGQISQQQSSGSGFLGF